jgi:Fe-S cluster assembly protein SufD
VVVLIHRYAQQTDAGQETKCLILSPKALVNVKPNLQIIADDVKKRIPFKQITEKALAQFKELLASSRQTTDEALRS